MNIIIDDPLIPQPNLIRFPYIFTRILRILCYCHTIAPYNMMGQLFLVVIMSKSLQGNHCDGEYRCNHTGVTIRV